MSSAILDRELKKGSAELLILSLVEDQPRHGYDIGQLIEMRSGGLLRFNVASLYPLLYRLEKRGWIRGAGLRKRDSGAVVITASRLRARRSWRRNAMAGWSSSKPSAGSPESNMPDWKEEIRKRLEGMSLSPVREHEIIEELSQHLEDQYEQNLRGPRPRRKLSRSPPLVRREQFVTGTHTRRAARSG
jgi:DNA-binding PadR family transcriptional regulator